jgi:hypothetical protein
MSAARCADQNLRGSSPGWSSDLDYLHLLDADRGFFAWEWLRRTPAYRSAYSAAERGEPAPPSQCFGLERFEHPANAKGQARPIWTGDVAPDVIRAHVSDPFAPPRERVDLRLLSPLVTVAIGVDEVEHVLLSNGSHSVRIDVVVGTLIGCPATLTYLLHGISGLKGPIGALERLATLISTGRFAGPSASSIERRRRWIQELRVADALADGQGQQIIGRALFGEAVSTSRWRIESAPYRRRVQRLVATARSRLAAPLESWFTA